MTKLDIVVVYKECKDIAADHAALLCDFESRMERAKKASKEEADYELQTASMIGEKLARSEKELTSKLDILELFVKDQ
tara:strand:+ start:207 stop:440 length:234 start_codon:yes stop_codon:yes gene_type:complete